MVIEELIGLAKDLRTAQQRGEELGLSDDEVAFYDALRDVVMEKEKEYAEADAADEPRKYDIRKILAPGRDAMTDAIAEKMRLFGSAGKA